MDRNLNALVVGEGGVLLEIVVLEFLKCVFVEVVGGEKGREGEVVFVDEVLYVVGVVDAEAVFSAEELKLLVGAGTSGEEALVEAVLALASGKCMMNWRWC